MLSQNAVQQIIIQAPAFLFALTFHELSHGYIANLLGDPTAKNAGRLTLNPLKHLDPLGTLAIFIIKIGWAKPVPVNPNNFKNPQKDMLLVALAGPGSNMILAIVSAILVKLLLVLPVLPIYIMNPLYLMLKTSVWVNVLLAVFNCLPIPPLDGSKILMGLLPLNLAYSYSRIEPYGFILLLILFATGVLEKVIWPIINLAVYILLS